MDAIVGWTGFIGQKLAAAVVGADLYNSSNISDLKNKSYEKLYFCGMPGEKWRINQNPEPDYRNTLELIEILKTVTVKQFILISTVDVLDCTLAQDERGTAMATHSYGKHRGIMEEFVKSQFPNCLILRLPGLFGKGLKKNILYDLIFDNQLSNICLESEFQWYNADNIMTDIQTCLSRNIRCAQLVSPPISVRTIVLRFFPEKLAEAKGQARVKYCLITSYNSYWTTEEAILEEIDRYVKYEMALKSLPCELAVSNIAWSHTRIPDILKVLSANRIKYLEIAPTKIAAWSAWSDEIISSLKTLHIKFVSCQSILFNTELTVFGDSDRFLTHYEQVAILCKKLGISIIVFGSPNARHLGETTEKNKITLFRNIGEIGSKYGVTCCLEANAQAYKCTWLTNLSDTVDFVQKVANPYVKVNYDTGNYLMEADTFMWDTETIRLLGHVQVSNRFLMPLTRDISVKYAEQIKQIIGLGYKGAISLEMNEAPIYDLLNSINIFVGLHQYSQ